MPAYVTHENFKASDHFNDTTGKLFDWDQHGYEIAYYPANAYGTWTYADADDPNAPADDVFTIDTLPNGDPMIRDHDGDVLCGGCATKWLADNNDAVCTIAFQVNGEVGDAETVWCSDCHGVIYKGADYNEEDDTAAADALNGNDGKPWALAHMLD